MRALSFGARSPKFVKLSEGPGRANGYSLVVIYSVIVIRILNYIDDVQTLPYAGTFSETRLLCILSSIRI